MLSHSPRIATDGLVLCLDAGNVRSYPGSGSTWYDLSGNNRNATFTSTPTFNTNCFSITDNTTYATTSVTPVTLNIYDASYTCEAVASFSNVSGDNMIFGNPSQGVRAGWHLGTRNTSFYFGHYGSDTSAGTASINTIYHMVWTFLKGESSNLAKIWVNGTSINSGSNIGSYIATNNIMIGSGFETSNTRFGGNLYGARIYNRVLENYEIKQNYLATKGRFNL